MTKTEAVIRSIMGVTRADIRPLAYAVDIAAELMFVHKISMDDLFVTDHIYPDVAKRLRQTLGTSTSSFSRPSPGASSDWPTDAGKTLSQKG